MLQNCTVNQQPYSAQCCRRKRKNANCPVWSCKPPSERRNGHTTADLDWSACDMATTAAAAVQRVWSNGTNSYDRLPTYGPDQTADNKYSIAFNQFEEPFPWPLWNFWDFFLRLLQTLPMTWNISLGTSKMRSFDPQFENYIVIIKWLDSSFSWPQEQWMKLFFLR